MWIQDYPGLEVALLPFEDNVFYVLLRNGEALVVDPPSASSVADLLRERKAKLCAILITHGDGDHIEGVGELVRDSGAVVYGPEEMRVDFNFQAMRDNQVLPWQGLSIRALDTKGHRPTHLAFYLSEPAPGLLFSGDALFAAGCGRIFSNPPEWMFASLQKLAALPPETHLYCGHDYLEGNLLFGLSVEPDHAAMKHRLDDVRARHRAGQATLPSTLALEKETNPFLRVSNVAAFAALRRKKDGFGSFISVHSHIRMNETGGAKRK